MKVQSLTAAAFSCLAALSLSACDKGGDNGSGQKTTGHIESAVGSLTGSEKMKRQGKKDEVVGGFKGAVSNFKDAVHDAAK
jgi:uncharacterized protein YjbJ (UPF0337 family)